MREYLFNMPAESIISVVAKKENSNDHETIFVIKEGKYNLKRIGKAPKVNIRGGIVQGEDAAALVVMFNFNDLEFKYDSWFNYYTMYGRKAVTKLAEQESILFECIDISGKTVNQFRISNTISSLAQNYIDICNNYNPWEAHSFYALKMIMFDECNYSEDALWDELSEQKSI